MPVASKFSVSNGGGYALGSALGRPLGNALGSVPGNVVGEALAVLVGGVGVTSGGCACWHPDRIRRPKIIMLKKYWILIRVTIR